MKSQTIISDYTSSKTMIMIEQNTRDKRWSEDKLPTMQADQGNAVLQNRLVYNEGVVRTLKVRWTVKDFDIIQRSTAGISNLSRSGISIGLPFFLRTSAEEICILFYPAIPRT